MLDDHMLKMCAAQWYAQSKAMHQYTTDYAMAYTVARGFVYKSSFFHIQIYSSAFLFEVMGGGILSSNK